VVELRDRLLAQLRRNMIAMARELARDRSADQRVWGEQVMEVTAMLDHRGADVVKNYSSGRTVVNLPGQVSADKCPLWCHVTQNPAKS
jgi:hypothetical protein